MPRLFIVSTEPAPYKTDLYNAFTEQDWDVSVFYAQTKSWEPDAAHDFTVFPERRYRASFHKGKGLTGQLKSAFRVVRFLKQPPDFLIVCTLSRLPFVTAVLLAVIKGIPFAMWDDHFNIALPNIKLLFAGRIRHFVRWLVFRYSQAVLICGNYGRATAIEAGCPEYKLVNFPYVIDPVRLKSLAEKTDPSIHIENENVILFSGRMIERKGLGGLLTALSQLMKQDEDFFLIIEGDGPLKQHYQEMAAELGLNDRVIFVGFSQMDRHAFLLSRSDIVVVPSTDDPWGIVVHEGMIMGKAVCASDAVCSAKDRIQNGKNGFLFQSGAWSALADALKKLMHDREIRRELGRSARVTAEHWSPKRNVEALWSHLKRSDSIADED